MNKWYVSISNKAKGPYSDLQVRDKITSGELKADTLSYKEGEPDWLPLEKQDIWTPGFTPKHPLETKDSKDWVLLVESPLKKGDFEQQGPFTDTEVKEKIKIGEVHLKDFCWKPGMATWKPLFESYELGLPRKDKITFVEDQKEEPARSSDFAPKLEVLSQMPAFIEPEGVVPSDTETSVENDPEVVKKKSLRRRLLPPIEQVQQPQEVIIYLALVTALFLGSFYTGFKYNQNILKGVQTLGQGLVSITKAVLPSAPTVSYVFLRELPLTRGTLLVKTDAPQGAPVTARVYDDGGKLVRTIKNKQGLSLKTNKNGEVFLGLGQFNVSKGKSYLVTAQVGSLKAKKNYTYTF
jgi:hypothetical protein